MSRPAGRADREEYRADARADHADDIAEARAEAAWDDFDGFELAREHDRYLTGFGWDR